jgi:hypothetical protein
MVDELKTANAPRPLPEVRTRAKALAGAVVAQVVPALRSSDRSRLLNETVVRIEANRSQRRRRSQAWSRAAIVLAGRLTSIGQSHEFADDRSQAPNM